VNSIGANSKTAENPTNITPSSPTLQPSDKDKERLSNIADSAYYKAESRGFSPGYELDDWLAAEAEEK
jgi:hypothetical protein